MPLKFIIHDPKITVLQTPEEFFKTLKTLVKNSRERIVISSLYIGTGELEKEFVDNIIDNKNIKDIQVDILLDKQRGTRPEGKQKETSISILSKLFKYGNNINISLFHNPLLGAMLYNILPHRANEALGVMHMKIYMGDDTLIMSGANLNNSYLTNRKDRYFLIENKLLANSIYKIVNCVQQMSFSLNPDLTVDWRSDLINPLIESYLYREQFYRRIRFILREVQKDISEYNINTFGTDFVTHNNDNTLLHSDKEMEKNNDQQNEYTQAYDINNFSTSFNISEKKSDIHLHNIGNNTTEHDSKTNNHIPSKINNFFYPLYEKKKKIVTIELGMQCPFSIPPIYDDTDMLEDTLKNIEKYNQSLIVASAYFNFTKPILKLFRRIYDNLFPKKGRIHFITAAQSANSFYKSQGITYYIPLAYSIIADRCIEFVTSNFLNLFKIVKKTPNLEQKLYNATNIYLEYHKPEWTFHSKGMWIIDNFGNSENDKKHVCSEKCEQNIQKLENNSYNLENCLNMSEFCDYKKSVYKQILSDESNNINQLLEPPECMPWGTVIGSSNYGRRASYRDLEMGFIIKTNDPNLRKQFQEELNNIYKSSKYVNMVDLKSRYSPWQLYVLNIFFRRML
ncbi:phosphatidylglycerophosphate synthase, putative [Plasmodium chabaudi chabaudi]|uniref:CDP-diacylglycerol--glycerol-3-phosphate 3-phosphatidyltransferase n=1 Tax=Plasmodium chabaudi chabaudi TaxID=31271 RepID=A0A4V6M948_PLACU|nr:phosphatidylglycerophosphate synthase, putative [Plasmodium chabaudi chabaudi]VTZ68067.1 phosphatidylglycerophosphate synthase, putative [Plasmodium chabaudi chabaudi]|eukprot:XP_743475.1 phosphatidylglycerophosphate synthase, putative [Plasmodium chabaudi chabaudi]